jgi:hypothetical protein
VLTSPKVLRVMAELAELYQLGWADRSQIGSKTRSVFPRAELRFRLQGTRTMQGAFSLHRAPKDIGAVR